MKMKKGFTLIELLVVVAIIGILASVVLASLNTARSKGADAAVKADMANVRPQAEIYYDGTGAGKYASAAIAATGAAGAICGATTGMFSDPNITAAIAHIKDQMAGTSVMKCMVDSTGQFWAMSVSALKGTGLWCVDNSGWAKTGTAGTGGICA